MPAPLGRVAGDSDDRTWEVIGAIGRGLAYAGVLVAAGGTAFLVLVHRGGAERDRARADRVRRRGGGRAGVAGGLAGAGRAGHRAGTWLALRRGRARARSPRTAWVSACCSPLVGPGASARPRSPACPSLALGGAAVAAGSFATNGHTRAGSQRRAGDGRRRLPPLGRGRVGRAGSCCCGSSCARRRERGRPHGHDRDRRTVLHPRHRRRRARRGDRRPARVERGADPRRPHEHRLRPAAPRQGRRSSRGSPRSAPTTTSGWCPRSRRGKADGRARAALDHAPASRS